MVDTVDNVRVRVSADGVGTAERELKRWQRSFDKATGGVAGSVQRAESQIRGSSAQISSSLRAMAASFGAVVGAREIVQAADSYTRLTNGLIAAGTASEDMAYVQDRLYAAAARNGTQAEALSQLYRRAALAGDALGASQETLLGLTDGVASALRVEGISATDARGPLLQLGQALASPIVRAEELNSLMEGVPEIARAAARGFGVSVADMRTAILDGKVTNTAFFQALQIGLVETEKLAAQLPLTIGNSYTVLTDALTRYIGQTDKALGASERIAAGINLLADNIDTIVPALGLFASVVAGKYAGSLAMAAIAQDGVISRSGALVSSVLREAEATRGAALSEQTRAKQSATSTAITVENAQKRAAALQAEIAQYRQNIAIAEKQIETARRVRQATDEATAALGRKIAVGAGELSSIKAGQQQQEQATRALIQTRRALAQAELNLAAQTKVLTVTQEENALATGRLATANRAASIAINRTSVAAVAGGVAVRGLSAAMAFFGGPVGVAIIAVGAAFAYLAAEGANARAAIDTAKSAVQEMASQGAAAKKQVEDLSGKLKDNASAANAAKTQTDGLSGAYEKLRVDALNAAEAVKYLTARQREQRIDEIEKGQKALRDTIGGGGVFSTNQEERVRNAERDLQRSLGISGSSAFGTFVSDEIAQRTKNTKDLTKEQQRLLGVYKAEKQVLGEMRAEERENQSVLDALTNARGTPTLKAPEPIILTPDRPSLGGGGSKDKAGAKAAENAERRRKEREQTLADEKRLLELEAAGDKAAIQAEKDRQRLAELTKQYTEAGSANAAQSAKEHLGYETQIRLSAERRTKFEKQAADALERMDKNADRIARRTQRIADLRRDELEYTVEIARLQGDEKGAKAAQRELDITRRTVELRNLGVANPQAVATQQVDSLISAQAYADMRTKFGSAFSEGIRAAMSGDLTTFFQNMVGSATERALQSYGESLFDQLGLGGLFKADTSKAVAEGAAQGTAFTSTVSPAFVASASLMSTSIISAGQIAAAAMAAAISTSGGLSGALSSLAGSLPSFAGGGYTGNSARSGGLDGKGGFLAMMHPRETVTDLTRNMPDPSRMLSANSGGPIDVRVRIDDDGGLQAYVERTSMGAATAMARRAVQVSVSRSIEANKKSFASNSAALAKRGTI